MRREMRDERGRKMEEKTEYHPLKDKIGKTSPAGVTLPFLKIQSDGINRMDKIFFLCPDAVPQQSFSPGWDGQGGCPASIRDGNQAISV